MSNYQAADAAVNARLPCLDRKIARSRQETETPLCKHVSLPAAGKTGKGIKKAAGRADGSAGPLRGMFDKGAVKRFVSESLAGRSAITR